MASKTPDQFDVLTAPFQDTDYMFASRGGKITATFRYSALYAAVRQGLSTFDGTYAGLSGKPTLFSGAYADLTGKPTFSTFSGAYADLTGKPSLFDGAYASLTGKPTLFDGTWASLTGKPTIPTRATLAVDNVDNTSDLNKPVSTAQATALASKQGAGAFIPLVDGPNIPVDASLGNNFKVTLGGNRTLAAPTNMLDGQEYDFEITQDGTGNRTLAFASVYYFAKGSRSTLNLTAGATTMLRTKYSSTSGLLSASIIGDISPASASFIGTLKPAGSQAGISEFFNAAHVGLKFRAPAHFDRMRIWVTSRECKISSGWRFAVACTDDVAYSSVASLFTPKKNGTTHNVIASSADELGWRIATWDNPSGLGYTGLTSKRSSGILYPTIDYTQGYGTLPADTAIADYICTDWIALSSFDPLIADPVTGEYRPWVLVRTDKISTSGVSESNSTYPTYAMNTYVAGQGYTIARDLPAGDVVADPTILPGSVTPDPLTTGGAMPAIFFEFDCRVPVRAFVNPGDSISEGYTWQSAAISQLSTQAKPFMLCNVGMSSNRPQQYEAQFYNLVKAGAHFTDVLYPSFSINDSFTDQNSYNVHKLRVEQMIEFCAVKGYTLWIWTCYNYFTQPQAQSINTWVRSLAALGKCKLVDIAANWDNRSDAAGGYVNADGVHPGSTLGIPYMTATLKAAILKG